uniref:DNA polymerase kappa n=1 Tax=Macrostomum lignano TaxID=282301 RepID=A0A1I8J180_9PLAT
MANSSSDTSRKNVIELNDNKAGMTGIDKARISQIIEEASRGSKFYQRQQAKRQADAKRAEETRRKIDALSREALQAGERAGDAEIRRAVSAADFSRTHVHIDMDAFYAAVEMLDNPRLRHVPMAVGGNDMLSTSNYAARRFGVRAAMPGFIAKKLCPQLVIVPCRFRRYKEVSRQVQAVLADYDPQFSAASLDEAYLDITDHLANRQAINLLPGPKATSVAELRYRVFISSSLTASAGIGPNPMVAKIGSDFNKPNGQYRVAGSSDRVLEFIRQLPVRKVPGIGRVTEAWLNSLGVSTCRDLYEQRGALYHACRPLTYQFYMRACLGLSGGFGYGRNGPDRKSVSVERTFQATDSLTWLLDEKLPELCESLVRHLTKSGFLGRTVTIKLKLDTFEVLTRSHGLPSATDSVQAIQSAAAALLRQEFLPGRPAPRIRLLGVRVSSLTPRKAVIADCSSGVGSAGPKQARLDELLVRSTKTIAETSTKTNTTAAVCSSSSNETVSKSSTPVTSSTSENASKFNLVESTSVETKTSASSASESALSCPICSASQPGGLAGLNRHLDFCLSRSAIQTAVNDYSNDGSACFTPGSNSASSRKRIEAASSSGRPAGGSASGGGKRARIAADGRTGVGTI